MKTKKNDDMKVTLEDGTETTLSAMAEAFHKAQDDQLKAISENLPAPTQEGEIIKLKPGRYSLVRDRDGAGDSGHMLVPFNWDTRKEVGENGTLQVGMGLKCGSMYARTFGSDWWLTTPITEILERSETKVRFRTGNSTYTVESF